MRAGRCAERLVDYWEVDGRMLCERHARGMGAAADSDGDGDSVRDDARARRATKRTTRFIDLAQLNGGGLR